MSDRSAEPWDDRFPDELRPITRTGRNHVISTPSDGNRHVAALNLVLAIEDEATDPTIPQTEPGNAAEIALAESFNDVLRVAGIATDGYPLPLMRAIIVRLNERGYVLASEADLAAAVEEDAALMASEWGKP